MDKWNKPWVKPWQFFFLKLLSDGTKPPQTRPVGAVEAVAAAASRRAGLRRRRRGGGHGPALGAADAGGGGRLDKAAEKAMEKRGEKNV